jgi:putative DNA primase/helicase
MKKERREQFRDAMRAAGLQYAGFILADGRLHRFKANGDRERNSWYILHDGSLVVGMFGCWKRSVKGSWNERAGNLSDSELKELRLRSGLAASQRVQSEKASHEKALQVAEWILSQSSPLKTHSYLVSKGIDVVGNVRKYRDAMVLELRDSNGERTGLQFISEDGRKRFLKGSRVAGSFFTLSDDPNLPLVICEGYATGASIHKATRRATVIAFSAGNVPRVAIDLRKKWPQREIIIAADNDAFTSGNPGVTRATEAAIAIGGKLVVPQFGNTSSRPTDFNDLAKLEGLDVVRRQVETASLPPESDDEVLQRLASLPKIEYERQRKFEAHRLGYRVRVLDEFVEARRDKQDPSKVALQGRVLELEDVKPWPESVDGSEILAELVETFCRYIVLPINAAVVLALWCVHTFVFDAFDCSPRLNICSPEKGCGKTTLRDVISRIVPRALSMENLTVAVLFRVIESYSPILLVDECDAWLTNHDELRGLLNSGHRRDGQAFRCEGEGNEVRAFNVFAPVVLCGIGQLPSTLHDRSIRIRLERARPGEMRERFDMRHTQREAVLRRKIARLCLDYRAMFETIDPLLPSVAYNRVADNWRPLFAVAQIVGSDWPARAAAAFNSVGMDEDPEGQGIGIMLLADIQKIFAEAKVLRIFSRVLVENLIEMSDRPWPEAHRGRPINERWLAGRLRHFGILSKSMRIEPDRAKGYELAAFDDAFARYIPEHCEIIRDSVTIEEEIGPGRNSRRDNSNGCHGSELQKDSENVGLSPCHASGPNETTESLIVGEV